MVKKKLTQLLAVSAIGFVGFGGQAFAACSTKAWDSATATAKSIVDSGISYEGLCALNAASGTVRQASKINGSGNTYVRFYVFAKSGASGTVFQSGDLKAELSGGGSLIVGGQSISLVPNKWHQVQLQIKPTTTKVWVDNKVVITNASGLAKVEEVVFGGATGNVFIDAVAVSNGKAIGDDGVSIGSDKKLIPGDANGDGEVSEKDLVGVLQFSFGSLFGEFNGLNNSDVSGVPDMNKDGVINEDDVTLIKEKVFQDLFK